MLVFFFPLVIHEVNLLAIEKTKQKKTNNRRSVKKEEKSCPFFPEALCSVGSLFVCFQTSFSDLSHGRLSAGGFLRRVIVTCMSDLGATERP